MPDTFKSFIKHMDGVNRAKFADAAAKAMAEHCDKRIAKVADILFPPDEPRGRNGMVDHSADGNLESVIIELQIRDADKVCLRTLEGVLKQLTRARRVLGRRR